MISKNYEDWPTPEELPEEVPNVLRDTIASLGPAMEQISIAMDAYKAGNFGLDELEKKVSGPCDTLLKGMTFFDVLVSPDSEEERRAHNGSQALYYRTLANVYRTLEKYDVSRRHLYKVLDLLGDIPKGLEIFQLEAAVDLGDILHRMKLAKEIKRNLKKCKELLDICRSKNEADFLTPEQNSDYYNMYYVMLQKMVEVKQAESPGKLIDSLHVQLLQLYQRYYADIHLDMGKVCHNGVLLLKYEIKYDIVKPALWIEHATELSAYSMEIKAFKQSHYLLRAAQTMLNNQKPMINEENLPNCLGAINDFRYLQGCIDLGMARHCLLLIYETRNRQLIRERAKKGPLSDEDKKDLELNESAVEFEGLEVPKCNEILDRTCVNVEEIVKMHKKVKELLVSVNEKLTDFERNAHDYEAIATKCRELKDAFPFLED